MTLAFSDGGIIELRASPDGGRRWDHLEAAGFSRVEDKTPDAVNLFAPDLEPILDGADSPAETKPDEGVSGTRLTVAGSASSSLSPPGLRTPPSLLTKRRRIERRRGRPSTSVSTLTPRTLGVRVTESFSAFGTWRAEIPSISSRKE